MQWFPWMLEEWMMIYTKFSFFFIFSQPFVWYDFHRFIESNRNWKIYLHTKTLICMNGNLELDDSVISVMKMYNYDVKDYWLIIVKVNDIFVILHKTYFTSSCIIQRFWKSAIQLSEFYYYLVWCFIWQYFNPGGELVLYVQ